ncbi:MAG: Regulator of RpoS [Nitrospirae bacterium]|nr:Regulator of RpoS [Nitrospirota bacterium]MCK6492014.1 response regulator [Nitrospira sp.]MEB2338853.1 response regulator [Nitrospirales bacterium]
MAIMIVEDNVVSAKLVEGLLQRAGYQTVTAKHGKEALELLPTICNVQLIITDYLMPEMNGIELIQQLKTLPGLRDIPAIILSAHCDVPTVKVARGLHCNAILVKPVKKEQLLERVQEVLSTQPLVLHSKFDVSDALQIGEEEYQELIDILAAQVDETIPIAVLEESTSHEPMSETLNQLLSALAESASLLGADKFSHLYAKLVADKALTRSQLPALLRVLQELALELSARRSPKKVNDPAKAPPPKEASAA